MGKMFQLEKREHLLWMESKRAMEEKKKIYIYGCGEIGKYVCDFLLFKGIPVEGFLVDVPFYKENISYKNVVAFCTESTEWDDDAIIFVAIKDYNREKLTKLARKAELIEVDVLSVHFKDDLEAMTWELVCSEWEKWTKLYEDLADEKSKRCVKAYLNQRLSGDFSYLEAIWEENQYCDNAIVDFKRIEALVDCGAYDGDSYRLFKKNYRECVGEDYTGKAFLLEPDTTNYQKLCFNCKEDKNCCILKLGAWDKKERLSFSTSGIASEISEGGNVCIDVDTIDHIVGGEKIDYIKMDIEGSELCALQGAVNTVKKHRPILAICVYHKKDDLLTIPQYIHSICPEYEFYLRAYSRYAQEFVLYAIPKGD